MAGDNPIYWIPFATYVLGIGLFFFGLFGPGFIISDLFAPGAFVLAIGSIALIHGYLRFQWCLTVFAPKSCGPVDLGAYWFFTVLTIMGWFLIVVQVYIQLRRNRLVF